ncbi:MAG: SoxR reducing system RseC family protein [Bacteroidales bacterium]|nr:SoxR reducing system RseC family protein [Bacteroidales bacterium]
MAEKSSSKIAHVGKIVEINPQFTSVEIVSMSACAECHAKNLCGVSDEKIKIIMVPTDPYGNFELGDEVNVFLKRSMGWKAVWISYVIPLIILLILIVSLSAVTAHEVYVGLGAIAGVAVYYLFVYLFRNRLAKDYVFYIKEIRK